MEEVLACTVMPETGAPVRLASVPVIVTVEDGVATWGVIPVIEMAMAGVSAASACDDCCWAELAAARGADSASIGPATASRTAMDALRARTTERTVRML